MSRIYEFKDELDMWMGFLAEYDWPEDAKPYVDGEAIMVPEVYLRGGGQVVEWVRARNRDEMLRVLGMGPLFD